MQKRKRTTAVSTAKTTVVRPTRGENEIEQRSSDEVMDVETRSTREQVAKATSTAHAKQILNTRTKRKCERNSRRSTATIGTIPRDKRGRFTQRSKATNTDKR